MLLSQFITIGKYDLDVAMNLGNQLFQIFKDLLNFNNNGSPLYHYDIKSSNFFIKILDDDYYRLILADVNEISFNP